MATPILFTERLHLRAFEKSDFEELLALHSNASVNRHLIPEAPHWSKDRVRDMLDMYLTDEKQLGFSQWRIETREQRFVGRAGFSLLEETAEVKLDCVLKEPLWGLGLGGEVCKALVNWFFENTYYSHLVAEVHPQNRAALSILGSVGMEYRERRFESGQVRDYFQVLSPSCRRLAHSA
ncbi:GNAT family N-acetyltransferase [Pseudovibrio flavus]|uniref:GNAT family N-acetyltransferase n=1 Tax=Pseudovibrio flavus TaxID=2529854 RepID=UPI00211BF04F|nr:GNAT family N-acetyltransferase [Pseudovibrio flavus]